MTLSSRVRYWLPLLPLLGLLGATYWLDQQVQPVPAKPDASKRHDPDAIMENFSATKMNILGVPSFVIAAKKMLHYPDDDSTTLDDPHIDMLSAENPTVHVVAKTGTVSSNGDEIFLHDKVEVTRDASARQDELTLHTEYLHIIPDKNLTDTDRAVTLANAHSTIHAIGLEMNSQTRILKLLSQVTSEYVQNRH
ncbi:MAG: LPS export ABC transporter periplasmic protein LptC [Gallionella sp.]